MSNADYDQVSAADITAAIAALGGQFVVDPEHGPDELGEQHRTDLLGFLASIVATYTTIATNPQGADQGPKWVHGFLACQANNTESALLALGGLQLAESMALKAMPVPTFITRVAAESTDMTSTMTMLAAAWNSTDPDLALTTEHKRDLLARARRSLTRMRGALGAVERSLK